MKDEFGIKALYEAFQSNAIQTLLSNLNMQQLLAAS